MSAERSSTSPGADAAPGTDGVSSADGSAPDVIFVLPGQLRDLTGGRSRTSVPVPGAGTLDEAFQALREAYPGLYDRVFTEQRKLRPHVNVFVDGADIRWSGGMDARVRAGSEVVILPAVSGG